MIDRRVKKTRKACQEALIALMLEKDFEVITVQDVLDLANVGRSTFYAHFYSLEDLLNSEFEVLQEEFEHFMAQHSGEASIWTISQLIFKHAQSYQRLYKAVAGRESGRIIHSRFQQTLQKYFHEQMKMNWGDSVDHELITLELIEHYLVSSFSSLLSFWLDKGLPYSAEQMAQIYQDLTKAGLDRLYNKHSEN